MVIQMEDFTLHIKKAVVLITDGTDRVTIHTDLPSPYPPEVSEDDLMIVFETRKGAGMDYVRKEFGIEPEMLDVSVRSVRQGKTVLSRR